jgi:hypothetical protein
VADLKVRWEKKGIEQLNIFYQNTNRDRGKVTLKALQEWYISVVPRDRNEPPCLYVNRIRAGHYQVPISIPDYTTGIAKLTEHGRLL